MPTAVLIPLDRSADAQAALAVGATFARWWNIPTGLITVVVPNTDTAEAAEYLRAVAANAGLPAPNVEVVVSTAPAEAILRAARERDAIICMATHSRGRLGELMLGSLSQAIVARSPDPIVLVGPSAQPGARAEPSIGHPLCGPILVPLDGSSTAEYALAAAAPWARQFGVSVHLVQAVPDDATSVSPSEPVALIEQAAPWTDPADLTVTAEVLGGQPARVITSAAQNRNSPLIVLTSRGATAEKNRTLSAVARQIVRTASMPVLVVPHHSAAASLPSGG
ncbi:MAG TPA: universal stress protein [Dermatophilaceae bacterium]